ncbi:MAG: hypothetical protein RO469_03370 [Thermincola sp.]|nr:hypothetical protein [Thermincola sp.]
MALLDCGELCGKICCCYKFPDDTEGGMELIPGEEAVFPLAAQWQRNRALTGEVYDYPPEWGGDAGCIQIRCVEPCPREQRPVNCRLFPFQILALKGQYYLVLAGSNQSYACPLLDRSDLINPEFVECARQAAGLLLEIPKFRELVDWDSAAAAEGGSLLSYRMMVKI